MGKFLLHLVMGLLTGGVWWIGLLFYHLVVKK